MEFLLFLGFWLLLGAIWDMIMPKNKEGERAEPTFTANELIKRSNR